ncbi:MAG TPA: leucyl/phenylalanyl-tRNA--protein transferase [Rectinemataceae bacterium]|nr:leucyl/phenylalanyl-tRNA--protein transferase [Rectinemataceae bacterium]
MRPRRAASFPYFDETMDYPFPDPSGADAQGLLCSGGNLSPGLLLSAYRRGIFPWYSDNEPILWWSPDPRFVLEPESLHVGETMLKILRRRERERAAGFLELTLDRDFGSVIEACSRTPRRGQRGTWITAGMIAAYRELHRLGYAHSVEARRRGALVGGLYGVSLGSIFFGESMFSFESDASKAAFIPLVWRLREEGFTLIDSQVYTDHLAGLGARQIERGDYLLRLAACLGAATRKGDWGALFPDFPLSETYRRIVLKEPERA